jgi:hypothetical protein
MMPNFSVTLIAAESFAALNSTSNPALNTKISNSTTFGPV